MNALENRIPPPVAVISLGAAMWLIARLTFHVAAPGAWTTAIATVVFVLGLIIGGSGLRSFRKAGTTINPVHLEAASALVTTGIFRFTRNPMYVGFIAMLTAWAVLLRAPWALLGVIAFWAFTWRFQILPEERVMQAKFGLQYTEYCRQVRRWL